MSEQNTGHLVVALAYEGPCTFEFGCTAELFALQRTVATLARRASMSPRTLQRHFPDSVGVAPLEWVVCERVAIARDLLETTIVPIGRVAEHVGFGSPESFRRHFRRMVGTSPAAYRR